MVEKLGSNSRRCHEMAGTYLSILLEGSYRSSWERFSRGSSNYINQAAVARVITEFLAAEPGAAEVPDARILKDKIYRALRGKHLTHNTLQWFASAFKFSEEHTRELFSIFHGIPGEELASDPLLQTFDPRTLPYRTVWFQETHIVGAEGGVVQRCVVQRVSATTGMSALVLRLVDVEDPNFIQVMGGEVTQIKSAYGKRLSMARLALDHALQPGDMTEIAYRLDVPSSPRLQIGRRLPLGVESGTLAVTFPTDYTPRSLYSGFWKGTSPEAPMICREDFLPAITEGNIVHRQYREVGEWVAGFAWTDP